MIGNVIKHGRHATSLGFQSTQASAIDRDAPINYIKPSTTPKPGRNEPCPCGSGKKYKRCHGSLTDKA